MHPSFSVGWRQVWASFVLVAAVTMVATTYGILAVPLEKEFQTSRMVLMLAMTVMMGATAVVSPLIGHLMDTVSLRKLTTVGVVCLIVGYLALSFVTNFVQVLAIFGVFMAAASTLAGPMMGMVLLSRWFTKRRGRAMGIMVAGVGLGGFIFPPIIQTLLDQFEWREALRILAVLLGVVAIPTALLIVNHPSDRGLFPDGETSESELEGDAEFQLPPSVWTILRDPSFWLVSLLFAVVMSGMQGTILNLVPLATDVGIDPSKAAYFVSIYAVASLVSKFVFAAFADKLNLRLLIAASVSGFALGLACLVQSGPQYALMAGGTVLFGFFGGLMMPLQSVLIPRIFGRSVTGRAAGLINVVLLVFMLSAPPAFGHIFDVFGNYDSIFLIFIGLSVATLFLIVPFIRLHPGGTARGNLAAA